MSSDNLGRHITWVEQLVDSVNFTLPGVEGSLGRDLAGKVAEGIAERSAIAQAPDGTDWEPNEDKYAAWKAKRYRIGGHEPNRRTGQMLSPKSLLGQTTVEPDLVLMKYGLGEPPNRTATGAALSVGDESITDIEKAYFCSKLRPFYALDERIKDEVFHVAQEAVNRLVRES